MIRRPPRSTQSRSSAASDVYKRQFLLLPHASALGHTTLSRPSSMPTSGGTSAIPSSRATASVIVPTLFHSALLQACLLYTSDAADDLLCVDLGGRRIIKKKK